MKWMIAVLYMLVSSVLFAAPLTLDQKEVTDLIVRLYSHTGNEFEGGVINGKFSREKVCDLYKNFMIEAVLIKKSGYGGCEGRPSLRYPSLGIEDIAGPYALNPLPMPKITLPVINGDKAQIEAIVKRSKFVDVGSRSVYFLTKTQDGWRIENALTYAEWPANPDPNADCKCNLLASPTAWQKAYLVRYEGFPN